MNRWNHLGQRTLYLTHDHAAALAIQVSIAAFLDDLSHGNLVVFLDTLTADQTFNSMVEGVRTRPAPVRSSRRG